MARGEYREARTPSSRGKHLDHLEIVVSKDGGHVVRHHYAEDGLIYHRPVEHSFGPDEGFELLEHVKKYANVEEIQPPTEGSD